MWRGMDFEEEEEGKNGRGVLLEIDWWERDSRSREWEKYGEIWWGKGEDESKMGEDNMKRCIEKREKQIKNR